MKIKTTFLLLGIVALFFGCNILNLGKNVSDIDPQEIILFDDMDQINFPNDPVFIDSVFVKGDKLQIFVGYSGGCEDHIFRLYGWTGVNKSNPPQAIILLSHDSKDDACEAFLNERLTFDLMPLQMNFRKLFQEKGSLLLRIYAPDVNEPIMPLPIYKF